MKLVEALEMLEPLQGKSAANILMRHDIQSVKAAIHTVFNRQSATEDDTHLASTVQAEILRHEHTGKSEI